MAINDAEIKQDEFNSMLGALNNYSPRVQKHNEAKNSQLNNAKNFYEGRKKVFEGFKERIFPLKSDDDEFGQYQASKKSTKADANAFNEWINKEEIGINRELFKKYFPFQTSSPLLKDLHKINDKKKNNKLVSLINSGL